MGGANLEVPVYKIRTPLRLAFLFRILLVLLTLSVRSADNHALQYVLLGATFSFVPLLGNHAVTSSWMHPRISSSPG